MNGDSERKVVVITGASAGVGRATARQFAKHGASVGLIARGTDGLEAAKREAEEMGAAALALPLDVADAAAVESAADRVEDELGPIDVWVNDAMVTVLAPFHQMSAEDFLRSAFLDMFGDPATNPKGWKTEAVEEGLSRDRTGMRCGPFGTALRKEEYVSEVSRYGGLRTSSPTCFSKKARSSSARTSTVNFPLRVCLGLFPLEN